MNPRFLQSNIATNISWLFLAKIAQAAGGIITFALIARHFGAAEFGKYNFILAVISIAGIFSGLGLKDSLIRRFVTREQDFSDLIKNSLYIRLFSGALSVIASVALIYFLRPHESDIIVLAAVMGLSLIFKAGEIFKFWFESQINSKYPVIIESIVICTFLLVKLYLVFAKAPLIIFALVFSVEAFANFVILLYVFYKIHSIPGGVYLNLSLIKSLVSESLPLLLSSMIIITTIHIDKILIGVILGDETLGIFSVASQIFIFVMSLIVIFEATLYPKFIYESSNSKLTLENIGTFYRRINQCQIVLIVLFFLFSENLIVIIFGAEFVDAASVANGLMVTSVLVTFARAFDLYHKVIRDFKYLVYRQSLILLIHIASFFFLAPCFGLISVVYASALAYFFVAMSTVIWGKRKKEMRYLYSGILVGVEA